MDELRRLIKRHRAAWKRIVRETGNVDEVNQFFHFPCIFVAADDSASLFRAAENISAFHRPRPESFRRGGVNELQAKDFEAIPLGTNCALVSVT